MEYYNINVELKSVRFLQLIKIFQQIHNINSYTPIIQGGPQAAHQRIT